MSTAAVRVVSEISDGGYYLPSLATGVLYLHYIQQTTVSVLFFTFTSEILLYTSFALLVSGVFMHSIEESISGPKSERQPTNYETGVQMLLHVMYKKGKPSDYPKNWSNISEVNHEMGKRRVSLIIFVGMLYCLWLISYPITVLELLDIIERGSYVVGGILFLEVAFILQALNGLLWPNSYKEKDIAAKVGIIEDTTEFRAFLRYVDSIELKDIRFETSEGGKVEVEYKISSAEEEVLIDSIESLAYGFAGTFMNGSYPCTRMVAILKRDEKSAVKVRIEKYWVKEMLEGNINQSYFIDKVLSTIEFIE